MKIFCFIQNFKRFRKIWVQNMRVQKDKNEKIVFQTQTLCLSLLLHAIFTVSMERAALLPYRKYFFFHSTVPSMWNVHQHICWLGTINLMPFETDMIRFDAIWEVHQNVHVENFRFGDGVIRDGVHHWNNGNNCSFRANKDRITGTHNNYPVQYFIARIRIRIHVEALHIGNENMLPFHPQLDRFRFRSVLWILWGKIRKTNWNHWVNG